MNPKFGKPIRPVSMTKWFEKNETTDAWNVPGYLDWFGKLPRQDQHLYLKDNRETLRNALGTCSGIFRGEFAYHNWVFKNGMALATAARKGTRLEVPAGTSLEAAQEFTLAVLGEIKKHKKFTHKELSELVSGK